MAPPNQEMSAPSRAAVLQEIEDVDGILGGGPFPTFRGRATSDPRPDAQQGQARGPERQLAAAALAIRQRSRTPSRPQRPRGLDALVEEPFPPMPSLPFRPPNPPFAQPSFGSGRPSRSRTGPADFPQKAPPRGFVLPPARQPPRDVRSPSGSQHMGQPVSSHPGPSLPPPPPIPPKSAQRQVQDNRRPSASGSRPTTSLNQAVLSRSSPPAPPPQPQVSRSFEGHQASSSSRPPVQTPPFEDDVFKGHLNPNNPYGYKQPPSFHHNWDTPARDQCMGIKPHGRPSHPFQGPPTGSRPRPPQHKQQQQQQSKVALPSQSSSSGASARARQAGHSTEPSYFDLSSLPPPRLQAQPGNGHSAQTVTSPVPNPVVTTTTEFGYHPMMSPYEAEAASGMVRARVESPKKNSYTPGGDHWTSARDMLSPVEAAVACADTRRRTIFMDMGVQYADDHEDDDE
ncbi:hypothetical protein NEUTE2DRAFT_130770 [Neurospora tetrasperma FGSC 2509]|nr:hypothetical protein NEUTE2DRAFT_130770 [Neurospora tetrasperma FGSC 2509]